MIGQQRSPVLGGRLPRTRQIPSHRRLRHRNPQLAELPMNAGCAPQGVSLAHAPYEIANLRRHLWSSRALPRFPGPIPGKGSPVPTDDGVWPARSAGRGANPTSSATAGPTSIGRSVAGAGEVARSCGARPVGDEGRESQPAGQHGPENWRRRERKEQPKQSSSWMQPSSHE